MTTHATLISRAARRRIAGIAFAFAVTACFVACSSTFATSLTWDNGAGTADYLGTGQWTNNTNWDPTAPSGGPVAGDDLTFDLFLDNPNVPRTSGTVSGTATDVAWLKNTAGSGTFSLNSMTFTGTSPKYIWATNPKTTGTYSTGQFLQPTGGITVAADSGAVFIGNANNNARASITFRLANNQSIVNTSAATLTFGTPVGTTFDSTTLVGGNTTTGVQINGWTAGTTPTVLTMSAAGSGDIVMNGNFSNGTSGLQLIVNNAGSGRVVSSGNFAFTSANLLNLPNPSGVRILAGTLLVAGTYSGSTTFTSNNGVEIATGGNLTITRSGAMPFSTPSTSGGGTMEYAGGSGSLLVVTGTLGHTGLTTVSSGTLQLAAGAALGTGPITVAAGATLDVNQPTTMSYGGAITGAGQLTKAGSGTFALSGNNAFTGGITITDNAGAGGISMTQLTVSQLLPGGSPGTLAVGGAGTLDISTANGAGGLAFRLGTASDLVSIASGNLQIGSGLVTFDDFTFIPSSGFDIGTYTLFSSNALLGTLGSSTTGPVGDKLGTLQVLGNTLQLVVTAVPEPSTTAALIAGLAMGAIVLRRRRD